VERFYTDRDLIYGAAHNVIVAASPLRRAAL
jgi:hypothetical protein